MTQGETTSVLIMRVLYHESEKKRVNEKKLINVSTQSNFCGYYVLARRIIIDGNFEPQLLTKFNQFYETSWDKKQLAEVLKNMHPIQADTLLGLVIYDQHNLGSNGEGLDSYELTKICTSFGYALSLSASEDLETSSEVVTEEQSLDSGRKIAVLLHQRKGATMGHYCLVEDDEVQVTAYGEQQNKLGESFNYCINKRTGKASKRLL